MGATATVGAEATARDNRGLAWRAARMAARQAGLRRDEERREMADLEEEAMIGLVRAEQGYRPDRGAKFSSYAMAAALNACRSWLRRRRGPLRDVAPLLGDVAEEAREEGSLAAALARSVLARLPWDLACALWLRCGLGFALHEVAAAMGLADRREAEGFVEKALALARLMEEEG